ncbi:MAG: hypothetical protein WD844_16785 [Thermoleophilaceae bacterium]
MTPRHLILLLVLAGSVAALSAVPAHAAPLRVGIADQKPETFSETHFRRLDVERTRYIVPWDAVNKPAERAQIYDWMRAARKRRMEIMVAFNLSSDQNCPAAPCSYPTVRAYSRAVRSFNRRFRRYGVKIYQPWNESNSGTQPTSSRGKRGRAGKLQARRGAKRVAQYYKVLRRMCGRRCTVTGADIQDIGAYTTYAKDFLRYVGRRRRPRIMGFHNYSDTNRRGYSRTRSFIRALPRGTRVWLTETGGLYKFVQQDGTVSLKPSSARQARSMSHMFKIQRRYRRNIDRIYIYQWRANAADRFDAGLVNPAGKPRRAYRVVRKYRKYIR